MGGVKLGCSTWYDPGAMGRREGGRKEGLGARREGMRRLMTGIDDAIIVFGGSGGWPLFRGAGAGEAGAGVTGAARALISAFASGSQTKRADRTRPKSVRLSFLSSAYELHYFKLHSAYLSISLSPFHAAFLQQTTTTTTDTTSTVAFGIVHIKIPQKL